ncbi:hypothetical protein [Streptomyces sp. NPDC001137]|uniref:hypothetical protein n=1 Tax=Streptomyces sp. NPDC001137 TaxID=3154378 RepID=UPI0033298909
MRAPRRPAVTARPASPDQERSRCPLPGPGQVLVHNRYFLLGVGRLRRAHPDRRRPSRRHGLRHRGRRARWAEDLRGLADRVQLLVDEPQRRCTDTHPASPGAHVVAARPAALDTEIARLTGLRPGLTRRTGQA